MPKKTEEIKVRVEPLNKLALLEIAERQQLDLSDVVRRALREYVQDHNNHDRQREHVHA